MMRLPHALLMALTVAAAALARDEQPLIVNGGFEDGTQGNVPGWSRSFYPPRAGIEACVERSDRRAKSGGWSLRIETGPVLDEEVTLVFNGAVSETAANLRGQSLVLSGWVYVEPGTAVRPVGMRLRTFGPDREGNNAFLGDVLSVQVLGKPGQWTSFSASGTVAQASISSMDLHCGIRPDAVPTVQYLDEIRLEPVIPLPLEIRTLRDALWRDETVLPVEVIVGQQRAAAKALLFRLLDAGGREVAHWGRPAATGMLGLPLPDRLLREGSYTLHAELRGANGEALASAEAPLELAASPWEDAPRAPPRRSGAPPVGEEAEGFRAMGTVAPTQAPDLVPEQPETTSPDARSAAWEERGYAVFSRHYLEPVSRLGRPRPGETGPLRLFACPGEYEPAQLSVCAIRPQQGVAVAASDLRSQNGAVAASNLEVRAVRALSGLPPFLERRQTVDISAGQTQTFWLTLRIPPDTKPGFYWGEVTVAPRGGVPTRLDLLARVLPLRLPVPQKGYGFWWKTDGRWQGYHSADRDTALEHIRRQFILLREHGCNMVSCYGMPKMTKAEDGTIAFDFEQDHWGHDKYSLADFFRLGRETGFFSPEHPIQYPGAESLHSSWIAQFTGLEADSTAFAEFYRNACRRVDRWAKEQGFTLAFACVDEIGNSAERRQDALRFYRLAQEAGVLTSVTDNSMHGGVHLMAQPRFDSIIAMRLYNFITPEMIEDSRRSGDRLWLYNMGSGGWNAKCDRFVFGLLTERCAAEGCTQWAFQWPDGNVDPYEAAASGKPSGYHYALPAPDGPLPTLALEGVREGIDDARYLALLRQRSPKSAAAALDDIEPLSTAVSAYLSRHSGSFFDVRRWRMAREAMEKEAAR